MKRTNTIIPVPAAAALVALAGAGLALPGCSHNQQITRVDPETVVDVDYRFNDSDARETYQAMVNDALFRKWIDNWSAAHAGAKPVVVVGPIRNETQEYIDTRSFTVQFERELLNSDRVRFVAMRDERQDIRDERASGQEWNTPETIKKMRAELGADFILTGRISDVKQRSTDGRQMVNTYQIAQEMVNLESNEKVWIGVHDIKKIVVQK
jgi:uncharacterized protein (TIGR02722 family)